MSFGQLVIGPPGAGKTSYVTAMHSFLTAPSNPAPRLVCTVNLDPANYSVPYPVDIDIKELIDMEEVMETFQLGPNGGLLYCIDYLEKNLSWLKSRIKDVQKTKAPSGQSLYFLFDLPGQVELYTHHQGLKSIVEKITQDWGMRLTCVHLIDSHHCSDPSKFLSVLLLSLNSMIQLELPHVNVLSKMDLIESLGPLEFGLEFYTDVLDLSYLLPRLREQAGGASHPLSRKFARLNKAMADLIESYNLVSFLPFAVDDLELLQQVLKVADKANGALYVPVADRSTGEGAKGSTTKDAASAAAGTAAATAASSSSSAATAAALRQRHHLLNSVDTSQLHDLHLPDIQERYLPSTTQIDAPNAPRPPPAAATLKAVVEHAGGPPPK